MKYMLLIYSPELAWTHDEWTACTIASGKICQELHAQGRFIAAAPLHPVATAASVRVRNGTPLITAGPFAETTEQLGGFFLIDVANLDEAMATALRLPSAQKGTVEIRPVAHLEGLPPDHFDQRATDHRDHSRYMLLCYDDEQYWNKQGPAALQAAHREAVQLAIHLSAREHYVSASPLHPIATATSVRIRQGKRLVTDGPFAETREFLGGYYLIDARDLNDAIAIAAQHPGARVGTVEVRRIVNLPDSQ